MCACMHQCVHAHSCVNDRQCVRVHSCMCAHPCLCVCVCVCVCVSASFNACRCTHHHYLELIFHSAVFFNAHFHMSVCECVVHISIVGAVPSDSCLHKFLRLFLCVCILSLQLGFVCVCVCVGTSVCVCMYVYMCEANTRFPLPRPAWFHQPDRKPPVSTKAPPSAATGFPEKNSV